MPRGIYLDNSQTTAPSLPVTAKMFSFFSEKWGVFSQPHQRGQELVSSVEEAYRYLYQLFGAKEEDTVVFVSSGAEAVNQVIQSAYFDLTLPTGKNHFIVAKTDEAPALMATHRLEQAGCIATSALPTVKGIIEALSPRTALVSLSWGNGLTGQIQPVQEIAQVLKERGVKFHLEASHVLGKLWFDPRQIGADYISFGGDLIHGPKSGGALWVKAKEKVPQLILGGLEQNGHRAGPLDVASFAALGEAAKEAREGLDFMATEVARLRGKFEREIMKHIPDAKILFRDQERLPHISCITVPGCPSEPFLYLLNREECFATMGGGSLQQIGYVLSALGVPDIESACALSFSLSRETTDEEIEKAVEIIKKVTEKLRKVSQL